MALLCGLEKYLAERASLATARWVDPMIEADYSCVTGDPYRSVPDEDAGDRAFE